jgi:Ferritin-like domain
VRKNKREIQISERELRQATADLDDFHRETFPAFQRSLEDWAEDARNGIRRTTERVASRRTFLMGAGAAAGGALLLASGAGTAAAATRGRAATAAGSSGGLLTANATTFSGDTEVAATAASLENLAVAAYSMGLQAATAGKLGAVPPAVANFATTAMTQHKAHAGAFNAVVTAAGKSAVTEPDPAVLPSVTAAFAKVTDIPGLAMLALELENVAANTYMSDLGKKITTPRLVGALATIQPVERQHVAILNFVLGQYPVPQTFQSVNVPAGDGARPPTDINQS